jgi:hypothetical protein
MRVPDANIQPLLSGSNTEVSSMRKFMILGTLVALVVAALALPALAQHQQDGSFGFGDGGDQEDYYEYLWDNFESRYGDAEGWDAFEDQFEDDFEDQGFFAFADNDRLFGEDGFFFGDDRFFEDDEEEEEEEEEEEDFDGSNGFGADISQSFEQEAESGDVS